MKDVQACSCARKHQETSFHICGAPVKLVQACVYAANTLHRRFNRRGGAEKQMEKAVFTTVELL